MYFYTYFQIHIHIYIYIYIYQPPHFLKLLWIFKILDEIPLFIMSNLKWEIIELLNTHVRYRVNRGGPLKVLDLSFLWGWWTGLSPIKKSKPLVVVVDYTHIFIIACGGKCVQNQVINPTFNTPTVPNLFFLLSST